MNNRESPLYWSIPCGTWFATRVRVSVWFPLVVLVICLRLRSAELGLAFSGLLFLSVLLHEFGHVIGARRTGGSGSEILIWPLGGLAYVQPGPTFAAQLFTTAAGPLVNLALCAVTLPAVVQSGEIAAAFNPFVIPAVSLQFTIGRDLLLLLFCANWVLLLINLIPVYPLDGGRMLQTVLTARMGGEPATEVYLRVGFIAAALAVLGGLMFDSIWVVAIGAVVLVLNMNETVQVRASDSYDDSFMGYDFSQGYTSLEKSAPPPAPPRQPGTIRRWLDRRRAEKTRRVEQQAAEEELLVDALLDKVHHHGIESLSDAERRMLKQASLRYRGKGKPNPS